MGSFLGRWQRSAQGEQAHKEPAQIPPLTYPSSPSDPWSLPEGRALPRPRTQQAATSTEHVSITGGTERGNMKEQQHFTAREGKVLRESEGAGAGQGVQDPFKQNFLPCHLVPLTSCSGPFGHHYQSCNLSFWMHFIGPDFLEVLVRDSRCRSREGRRAEGGQ